MADEQLGDVKVPHYLKRPSHEVELSCACSGHPRPHRLWKEVRHYRNFQVIILYSKQ
jgi:hypothetical protein